MRTKIVPKLLERFVDHGTGGRGSFARQVNTAGSRGYGRRQRRDAQNGEPGRVSVATSGEAFASRHDLPAQLGEADPVAAGRFGLA